MFEVQELHPLDTVLQTDGDPDAILLIGHPIADGEASRQHCRRFARRNIDSVDAGEVRFVTVQRDENMLRVIG